MKFIFGKAMLLASALLFSITGTGCSSDDSPASEKEKTHDMSGVAKGADVSWLTEMEGDLNKEVHLEVAVPGTTLFVEKTCDTFEEGIDQAVDSMKVQLTKFKEKTRNR